MSLEESLPAAKPRPAGDETARLPPRVAGDVARGRVVAGLALHPTEYWLAQGGDERIAVDAASGANRYGSAPRPDREQVALGSSTSSTVSAEGFAAAERLRWRLFRPASSPRAGRVPKSLTARFADELERIRGEVVGFCGATDLRGLDVVFGASGTDLHRTAALVACGSAPTPVLALVVDQSETGTGVPAALAHRGIDEVVPGPATGTTRGGGARVDVITVKVRHADGSPRPASDVDAEFTSLATRAAETGRRVLLVLVDVSKTGLVVPSVGCVTAIKALLREKVDILVDACQLRLSAPTVRSYLDQGFWVAVTGSKFMAGPSFAGALLLPGPPEVRLRSWPRALETRTASGAHPGTWGAGGIPDDAANIGLLLRWEAALEQMRAFRSVPEANVMRFLHAFGRAVGQRIQTDPVLSPLAVPPLDRGMPASGASWDRCQTIFPFMLRDPRSAMPLGMPQATRVWRLLQSELDAGCFGVAAGVARTRYQLGQAVCCGERDRRELGALRICASARLVVDAAVDGDDAVIQRALAALEKTSAIVRHLEL